MIKLNLLGAQRVKALTEILERKSQLWLVETLEQAQAIVNTPIGGDIDD